MMRAYLTCFCGMALAVSSLILSGCGTSSGGDAAARPAFRVSDADDPLGIIWSIAWIGEAATSP